EMEKKGKMPSSLTRGRIVLIPKKGNGTDFSHWRPITILNESYRILSGILAQQIQIQLNEKNGFHQKGFLKNCKIYDMSRSIQASIESVNKRK
ncbi:NELlike 1 (Silurana), partial [Caligus rogercresseyi]